MIVNKLGGGKSTKDATIVAPDVSLGDIAYGAEGRIVGTSPFKHISGDGAVSVPSSMYQSICYANGKFVATGSNGLIVYSSNGISWETATTPVGSTQYAITYGNGEFISSCGDYCLHSNDGINWTMTECPIGTTVYGLIYADNKYVAVGYSGNIWYSPDGIAWTQATSGVTKTLNYITYNDGKYVAVGASGTILYSPDGIAWTQATSPITSSLLSITYGDGKFVVGAASGMILYSTDAITWTLVQTSITSSIYDVIYANGKFVTANRNNTGLYSIDGINWNEMSMDGFNNAYRLAYGADIFVAIQYWMTGHATSSDGINWKRWIAGYLAEVHPDASIGLQSGSIGPRYLINDGYELKFEDDYTTTDATIVAKDVMLNEIAYGADGYVRGTAPFSLVREGKLQTPTNFSHIAYGADKFVAFCSSSSSYYYSDNGFDWVKASLPASANWYDFKYFNGVFGAISYKSNKFVYSTDGINWTLSNLPASRSWEQWTYGNGVFAAVAYGGNYAAYSTDGTTWTAVSNFPSGYYWEAITYGNGVFVATDWSYSTNIAYSTDGISWTSVDLPVEGDWFTVAYGNGKFIAVSTHRIKDDSGNRVTVKDSVLIITSEDGITWTDSSLAVVGASSPRVVYSEATGKFMIFSSNTICESSDGVNWSKRYLPTSCDYQKLAIGANKTIFISSKSIYYTEDGNNWYTTRDDIYDLEQLDPNIGVSLAVSGLNSRKLITEIIEKPWTEITLPASANWSSIVHGNDIYVAVASGSNIAAYSTDGITWTQTTLPASANWSSVTLGANRVYSDDSVDLEYYFIAVASGSNIAAYSTDGITWTEITLPASANWSSVTSGDAWVSLEDDSYVLLTFTVAVATDWSDIVAYSVDGINWDLSTLPSAICWSSVASSSAKSSSNSSTNSKFVALASNHTNIAAYSTNGITWTEITLPASANWSSVTCNGSRFVAVASDSNIVIYSDTGKDWSQSTLPVSASWSSVTYGDGRFTAIASGSNIAAYSTDGITWTQATLSNSASWQSIVYGNDKFVAVANSSSIAAYVDLVRKLKFESHGSYWKKLEEITPTDGFEACYLDGKWYASSQNGLYVSTDKVSWIKTTLTYGMWRVVKFKNILIALSISGGNGIKWSSDGITWTNCSSSTTDASFSSTNIGLFEMYYDEFILMENSNYCAYGTPGIWYSTDGKTWSLKVQGESGVSNTSCKFAYNGSRFVAVLKNIGVFYSTDAKTWTQTSCDANISVTGTNLRAVKNMFFLGGGTNYDTYASTDGISWSSTSKKLSISQILYNNGYYVAHDGNIVYYSTNGTSWSTGVSYVAPFSIYYLRNMWFLRCNNNVRYSTNGRSWSKTNLPNYCNTIIDAFGLFIASVEDNGIWYSTDGKTWTQSNITSGDYNKITYSMGRLVAADGTWYTSAVKDVLYTDDGKIWRKSNVRLGNAISLRFIEGLWLLLTKNSLYYSDVL